MVASRAPRGNLGSFPPAGGNQPFGSRAGQPAHLSGIFVPTPAARRFASVAQNDQHFAPALDQVLRGGILGQASRRLSLQPSHRSKSDPRPDRLLPEMLPEGKLLAAGHQYYLCRLLPGGGPVDRDETRALAGIIARRGRVDGILDAYPREPGD